MKNFLATLKKYIKAEWHNFKNNHKIKIITLLIVITLFPLTVPLAILAFLFGMLLTLMPGKLEYDKSLFKLTTNKSYFTVFFNTGNLAEYLTWQILDRQPEYKKTLVNLYIPNDLNTREIDSILINEYGIFVIESKGYSGWIFGNERDINWKQMLYNKQYYFYNPIIQNRNHIKSLAKILDLKDMNIFRSYIVFSQRCELKKVSTTKPNIKVIKRQQLNTTLNNDYEIYGKVLSINQINDIYNKLEKYMFVDSNVKKEHIQYVENLKKNINI